MKRLFVLGSSDPEMMEIENILTLHRQDYTYAMYKRHRVHGGTAYKAEYIQRMHAYDKIIFIECAMFNPNRVYTDKFKYIDHHRPGDFGYMKPPSEYFSASSLGQLLNYLQQAHIMVEITDHMAMIAAADHCLMAAYQGKCDGIDPNELMEWRLYNRSLFKHRPIEKMREDIQRATEALHTMPKTSFSDENGVVYSVADFGDDTIRELPEAASRAGLPFIATVKDPDGKSKRVLQCGSPELIAAWMKYQSGVLHRIYGDPVRGFAGGYIEK